MALTEDPLLISATYFGRTGKVVYSLRPSWTGSAGEMPTAAFQGNVLLHQARQLEGLCSNPEEQITINGEQGVLEFVWLGARGVSSFTGWYLLRSATYAPIRPGDFIPLVELRLEAVFLGNDLIPVYVRSARLKKSEWGRQGEAIVPNPFWDDVPSGSDFLTPPGGTRATREYDSSSPMNLGTGEARRLSFYRAPFVGSDPFPSVVYPPVPADTYAAHATPRFVTDRGHDVRLFDRARGHEVYDARPFFRLTTDIRVSNGLVDFWVGNPGMTPFLNVSIYLGGRREVGCLALSPYWDLASVLTAARVISATREEVVIGLMVRNQGEVIIGLQRGARMIQVISGSEHLGLVTGREIGWEALPPHIELLYAAIETVGAHRGLRIQAGGRAVFRWPTNQSREEWALLVRWVPDNASATQPNSGVASMVNPEGLTFDASTQTIRWTADGVVLSSPPVSFAAQEPVTILMRHRAGGRTLTVHVGGTVTHSSDTETMSGSWTGISFGQVGETVSGGGFGQQAFGEGPFGHSTVTGGTKANGLIEHAKLFRDWISSEPEAAAAVSASGYYDNLPSPEGRMVSFWPFDHPLDTFGSDLANGLTYETTSGGARYTTSIGTTRGLTPLQWSTKGPRLSVAKETDVFEVGAFIATGEAGDNVDDHANQFLVSQRGEVSVWHG